MRKITKLAFFIFGLLVISAKSYSASPWEGRWEIGRYYNDFGGRLTIKNCQNNVCEFDIGTIHGSHTCSVDGKLKINGNKAQHYEIMEIFEGEVPKKVAINFQLDEKKNIITVKCEGDCLYYCGMRGHFEGEYENENNPLRFKTSFDCWANVSDTEQAICADGNLAKADIEMDKKYKKAMTKTWREARDKCNAKVNCLWDFYVSSIAEEYQKEADKNVNLYEYLDNLNADGLYYPTDFALLRDYLSKNMEKGDFEEWQTAFGDISMEDNKCEKCYFHKYGVAGLYTTIESAFYINHDEIWIAFLHTDYEHKEDEYIIMYAPRGKTIYDIPEQYQKWLERLEPYYPNGIKLKHFSKQ
jgi:hypothetical protein